MALSPDHAARYGSAAGVFPSEDATPYTWQVYRLGRRLPLCPAALLPGNLVPCPVRGVPAGILLSQRGAALAAVTLVLVFQDGRLSSKVR